MKKKLLIPLLAASISLASIPITAMAAVTTQVQSIKVVKSVNFHTAPTTSSSRIRYLQAGETVSVIDQPNSYWYHVKDSKGTTGYVTTSVTYVSVVSRTETPPPPAPAAETNAKIVSSVSFRTGSSTSDSRIRYLQTGELVTILDKPNAYWYKISDKSGVVGYVSSNTKYIDATSYNDSDQASEQADGSFTTAPNGTIVHSVSFRTGPASSAGRIRYLKAGEQVLVLDKPSNYWYKVQTADGTVGYVSTNSYYISTTYTSAYKQMDHDSAVQKVIDAGMKYLGTPYEFASDRSTTTTFDCSDFVRQAFLDGIELQLPADSRSQGAFVKDRGAVVTDWHQLKKGDLMFFMSYKGYHASDYAGIDKNAERITHVGIYLGDGKILHTYSVKSGGVRVDTIGGSTWEYRFLFGGSAF